MLLSDLRTQTSYFFSTAIAMRIGCLQFAPQVGEVDNNLNRADAVLSRANPRNLDLLVLPELAFTGYNFKSLQEICPFLEPTTAGVTSLWARTAALKYECVVTVGYPEKVDITPKWPASPEYYNSAITVNSEGETIANYRKSFLYYTDETWALEGPDGFYDGEIEGLGNVAMGICKWPTNPYKFESPWSAWEFAYHILHKQANLVVLSMAWRTREDSRAFSRHPKEPDMETLSYWLARLEPVIRAETEGEIVVVLCNRCGTEGEAVYAGTSAVLGIHAGEVKVYGILGRGEKELLVVDTNRRPQAKLISQPNSTVSNRTQTSAGTSNTGKSRFTNATNPALQSPATPNTELTIDEILSPMSAVDIDIGISHFERGRQYEFDAIRARFKPEKEKPIDPVSGIASSEKSKEPNNKNSQSSVPKQPKHTIPAERPTPKQSTTQRSPIKDKGKAKETIPQDHQTPNPPPKQQHSHPTTTNPPKHQAPPSPYPPINLDSSTFIRPPSTKSRNASQTRAPLPQAAALRTHDLAEEARSLARSPSSMHVQQGNNPSPPRTSPVSLPERVLRMPFPVDGFGRRNVRLAPRPKSMIW
ncbi:hypothetical protein HYFRA_00011795 [Hymenoscyphus fraxineus]|uniref:CN hydrolase domain-containing protein n=1 Tax=Hymenoscyphus fraxineus TaxID=746836 RepID=A0A9N9L3K6_9HELO|nr:hypothetical protein HYFRA_00011795 [Hymenoscyphus fraxineus]